MKLINDEGYCSCTLMSQWGLEKVTFSDQWERGILTGIRDGSCDFIYDDVMLDKVICVLKPHEILVAERVQDYYKISLTTHARQMSHYKEWCVKNNYDERNAKYLKKFTKEVRVIWH